MYKKPLLFKMATVATAACLTLTLSACSQEVLPEPQPLPKKTTSQTPGPQKAESHKAEPMSAYGNPSYYHVRGKRYNVIANATKYDEVGIASWYGKDFDGKLTSNRETFHMNNLSAASRSLPLPCYVRVTNLSNQKSIVVRVNDRGPYKSSRIMDLSYAAAQALDFVNQGTTKVHITAVSMPDLTNGSHYLQVASFSHEGNAEKFKHLLTQYTNQPIRIRQDQKGPHDKYFRIEVGPYLSANKLHAAQLQFKERGFPHTIAIVG